MGASDGYQFMSVLTHTTGRQGVGPRQNVCGFNSETWNGRATVWDQPINWPTSSMSAGQRTFTWNISWGPHYPDTTDFKYWITKPGFQYQVGRALSFSDFEDLPFCSLTYDDAQPNANPNVIPNKSASTFQTRCNVPARSGRHVIYAEWGRNQWTYERFHGCIDVAFGGSSAVAAQASLQPMTSAGSSVMSADTRTSNATQMPELRGSGAITLDGRASQGSNLSYRWSVESHNPNLYTLTNADQAVATLTLNEPQAASNVKVSLVVTGDGVRSSDTRTLLHQPAAGAEWFDLGPFASEPLNLAAGDRVSVRTVSSTGQDAYWPSNGVAITKANAAANAWPLVLAQAVNASNGAVRIGVLNAKGQVVPSQSAAANRVYAKLSANITNAYLNPIKLIRHDEAHVH
jgi:chitin-binding protein